MKPCNTPSMMFPQPARDLLRQPIFRFHQGRVAFHRTKPLRDATNHRIHGNAEGLPGVYPFLLSQKYLLCHLVRDKWGCRCCACNPHRPCRWCRKGARAFRTNSAHRQDKPGGMLRYLAHLYSELSGWILLKVQCFSSALIRRDWPTQDEPHLVKPVEP